MPLPVVPIVTNNDDEDAADTHHVADTVVNDQESARKSGFYEAKSEKNSHTRRARQADPEADPGTNPDADSGWAGSPDATRTEPGEHSHARGRADESHVSTSPFRTLPASSQSASITAFVRMCRVSEAVPHALA
jgi:hypothetical protein